MLVTGHVYLFSATIEEYNLQLLHSSCFLSMILLSTPFPQPHRCNSGDRTARLGCLRGGAEDIKTHMYVCVSVAARQGVGIALVVRASRITVAVNHHPKSCRHLPLFRHLLLPADFSMGPIGMRFTRRPSPPHISRRNHWMDEVRSEPRPMAGAFRGLSMRRCSYLIPCPLAKTLRQNIAFPNPYELRLRALAKEAGICVLLSLEYLWWFVPGPYVPVESTPNIIFFLQLVGMDNFEKYPEVQIQGLPPIEDPYAACFTEL